MGKISKAQIKAVQKYEKANYDKTTLRMPKGKLDELREAADRESLSVNGWIMAAVDMALSGEAASRPSILTEAAEERAKEAATAAGVPLADWLTGAIEGTAAMEANKRKLSRELAAFRAKEKE